MENSEMHQSDVQQEVNPTPKHPMMEAKPVNMTPQQPKVEIPEELTQQQGLQVLIDAAKISQSKGIFTLDDAELINKAIKAFIPKGPVPSSM